ncbi:UDP-N-acetylenolpyruvoylglucosamine reductase [Candidatus Thermoflexus japonica]|uniref:UDP-N-acetylenolpyruvoylglucosamine reductase n=1 Tax=Candidatus Thermoflexus japonica TaxID=2035417 RepID=A0A2H5Y710_9CHLR|nr:UDP-N-acetylenolpyruvoylglucosamine reductase [Candidatus Thermoflexus japonica]
MSDSRAIPGEALAAALQRWGLPLYRDVPLARFTTSRIGGPADALVMVEDVQALADVVQGAWADGVPVTLLGGGSNVLIADRGVRGLVVLNRARALRFESDGRVWAASGVLLPTLARLCAERGWSGLEWAIGVPGTVGGAVVGNAGAHGGDIASCLESVELLLPEEGIVTWGAGQLALGYRTSRLKTWPAAPRPVVLAARFLLRPEDPEVILERMAAFNAYRRRTQPGGASIGSMFRNPPGDYAGRLIEAAGLKGARRGGIVISTLHANFFINEGNGTAADVRALMMEVQRCVQERFGVLLEPEIEFVGEWEDETADSGGCAVRGEIRGA